MTQADNVVTTTTPETSKSGIEVVANLVAAYRNTKEEYYTIAEQEAVQCRSVGVELQVLKQLAQFDKLLIALK
jgi:hypothetical protein